MGWPGGGAGRCRLNGMGAERMRRLVVCDIDGTLIELSAAELDVFFGTF